MASRRSGSAPVTRTSDPFVMSGTHMEASPGGEAGFVSDSRRLPSVGERAAAAITVCWVASCHAVATSLGCGGSLSQTSRDDTSAEYHESITYGQDKCVDGGAVTVRFFKGNLSWVWIGQADGQPYNAVAVLTRQ